MVLRAPNPPMIDWNQVIIDIERGANISDGELALKIDRRRETINLWKNRGSEMRYSDGHMLITLWKQVTNKTEGQLPRLV